MLTSSSSTNYVPNEHEDVDLRQCHVVAILKVWNQNEIPIELLC